MADLSTITKHIASIAIPALRSFTLSFIGMLALGGMLAGPCFWVASKNSALYGGLAALIALGACGGFGWAVAMKRSIASGLLAAVTRFQAASETVRFVFDRIPKLKEAQEKASLIPAKEAETLFRGAVSDFISAPEAGGGFQGWIKRKIQTSLCERISLLTLAEFHASDGGVDLIKVRDKVAQKADSALKERLEDAKSSTLWLVLAAVVISVGVAVGFRFIPV